MKSLKSIIYFLLLLLLIAITEAVAVSAEEHIHFFSELYTAKPTCTERGYTVFSCDCGEAYEGNITDALGHTFSKDVVCFKKATCLGKGEGARYCQRCFTKTDIIYYDKTSHIPETVTVKATTKRNGEKRKECSVCKKNYSKKQINKISSVKLETKTYTYDGKVKTPSVIIKDIKGKKLVKNTDYTLKYQKGRKKTGTYSVKVTFKGNYEGEKTLYFKIIPTAVKNVAATPSISSVHISWDKSKGADGYEIYLKATKLKLIKDTQNLSHTVKKLDGKALKGGTDYVFVIKSYKKTGDRKIYSSSKKIKVSTKPQKARIKKVATSSGKTTVTVAKQNCHGCEILLSTNKSFSNPKKVTLKGKNVNSCTFKNLVRSKKYYVKVRAYVISGGEKYYGYYSEVKTFKA